MAGFFLLAGGRFSSLASHPSAKCALGVGHPRFGLGGKEPCAEILRWESPALPETPLPQDDVNFPTLLFRSSLATVRNASSPSAALRFGRDDRVISLCASDRVFFPPVGMAELSRCAGACFGSLVSHPFAKNAKGWGTVRFGLGKRNCPHAGWVVRGWSRFLASLGMTMFSGGTMQIPHFVRNDNI